MDRRRILGAAMLVLVLAAIALGFFAGEAGLSSPLGTGIFIALCIAIVAGIVLDIAELIERYRKEEKDTKK